MDFVEVLPLEIVEEICQHLSSKDILSCSLVSTKWREVLNSNRIWSHICTCERLHEKEYLNTDKSYFFNPIKRFTPIRNASERLSDICYWRSHYNQYKYLESNWRRGKFANHQLHVTCYAWPSYYKEGLLVVKTDTHFNIYSVRGSYLDLNKGKFAVVEFKNPNVGVKDVIILKDYLIYCQLECIIGLKLNGEKYEEVFNIELPVNEIKRELISELGHIVSTGVYLVFLHPFSPSKLFIYNIELRALEKELDLNKTKRGDQVWMCTRIEAFNNKVYLGINKSNSHMVYSVLEYDLARGECGAEFTVPLAVDRFFLAEGILCALMRQNNSVDTLYVWSLAESRLLTKVPINSRQPIIVTKGVIFHCENNTVIMQSMETFIYSKFIVRADTIINMNAVGKHLLAINTGDAIEIWDWGTGEKLYTPYRGVCSTSMWVDEQMIIVNKWSCNFQIIGFW